MAHNVHSLDICFQSSTPHKRRVRRRSGGVARWWRLFPLRLAGRPAGHLISHARPHNPFSNLYYYSAVQNTDKLSARLLPISPSAPPTTPSPPGGEYHNISLRRLSSFRHVVNICRSSSRRESAVAAGASHNVFVRPALCLCTDVLEGRIQ